MPMESVPTISIAIPTYNRCHLLAQTLACLINQETGNRFSYEVLVLDDGSTDATPEVAVQVAARATVPVRHIRTGGLGYTGALNRAVREFRGQWLAFFDDDQLTHSRWLFELYDTAMREQAEIVGGPIVLDPGPGVPEVIGPVCRDLCGETLQVHSRKGRQRKIPLPPGGNRLVHRRVFERLGTFDETMLTGGCDRDFLLRAVAARVVMAHAPRAVVRHRVGAERFTRDHIRWYSLQWGCSFAHIDRKRYGLGTTTLLASARVGQALLINLPLLIVARIRGESAEILDRWALVSRAVGYTRKTLQMLAPRLLRQERFFSRVEFRRGRERETLGKGE